MRDIPVGNGSLLITFDEHYRVRDVYFPHVGQENHSEGLPFRFGIWVDGEFSWVEAETWERSLKYLPDTLVTDVTLRNDTLGIEIACNDAVACDTNVFVRRVEVRNLRPHIRNARVFLHHDFRIYENPVGDTAFYDPASRSLIHYKKHRYFLINTAPHFDSFATGRKAFGEMEGTWRDAEDGELSGGAITEGSVDSTVGVHFDLAPGSSYEFYYWMAAGTSRDKVRAQNQVVLTVGPEQLLRSTEIYWRAWVNKNDTEFGELPEPVVEQFKRSLLIVRTQIDDDGAILAANDSDVTLRATDHYSYLWTRDGAFVANALDAAGFSHLARRFYHFCGRIVHADGYFLQKYNPDGTVASGWHSAWDPARQETLVPIQEDETALVLWAFWEHYSKFRDIEFAQALYRPLVTACADFMLDFRDPETNLPLPSWNLWEDRRGVHTFTCSTVVAGLRAAANFARLFGDVGRAESYEKGAEEIKAAMAEHLYSDILGRFIRAIQANGDGTSAPDETVDASLFGLFYFGVFDPRDERVQGTMSAVAETLRAGDAVARFENDGYMRTQKDGPGNIWFICTLWLAEYYISAARTVEELKPALNILEWTAANTLPSGVLAEQLDPSTGGQVSVSPLTWSHSTFIAAVSHYQQKLHELLQLPT